MVNTTTTEADNTLLYIAELELEVDRLRRQANHLYCEAKDALSIVSAQDSHLDNTGDPKKHLERIAEVVRKLSSVILDVREPVNYHPGNDQVVGIALRPLINQVFRWQTRIMKAECISLRLDLTTDYIEWFPARLIHIFDHLISNSIKYRDQSRGESRIGIAIRVSPTAYEISISDNGRQAAFLDGATPIELLVLSKPIRDSRPGTGLAIVKILVEQSGGSIRSSFDTEGNMTQMILPRFDAHDFLENNS